MPSKVAPLDRQDPAVAAARTAEREAYARYGLEPEDHLIEVPALGCTIRVAVVGSGPPVVLIPGGHGPGVIWTQLLPELEEWTAYVMDRPGRRDAVPHGLLPRGRHRTPPVARRNRDLRRARPRLSGYPNLTPWFYPCRFFPTYSSDFSSGAGPCRA